MIGKDHLALPSMSQGKLLLLLPHRRQLYAGVSLHSSIDSFSPSFMGNTSSDLVPQVMHCVSGESWFDGVIIFQRLPPAQQERQDVYRLRVVGHEIQLLPIHYCARGLALAPYRVLLNSSFHFEASPAMVLVLQSGCQIKPVHE